AKRKSFCFSLIVKGKTTSTFSWFSLQSERLKTPLRESKESFPILNDANSVLLVNEQELNKRVNKTRIILTAILCT
ncbi:MAG: hypothetical protein ACPGVW_14110, partial [Pseudoalteromonas marina]